MSDDDFATFESKKDKIEKIIAHLQTLSAEDMNDNDKVRNALYAVKKET